MATFAYPVTLGGACTKLMIFLSSTYTAVYNLASIDGPSITRGTRDTTAMCATWKTFAGTVVDGGEVTGHVFISPGDPTQQIMFNLLTDPNNYQFKILFTDLSNFTFSAAVTSFEVSGVEVEGTVMAAIKLKVNGPITWSPT